MSNLDASHAQNSTPQPASNVLVAARPGLRRVLAAGASSLGLAVTGSITLYALGRATGWIAAATVGSDVPGIMAVIGMASAAPIVAAGTFALITRFVPRPGAAFAVLAALVYAGFLPGPIHLDAPLSTTLLLEAMHLAVAVPVTAQLLGTLSTRSASDHASTPVFDAAA